jgi:hypothetical protein
MGMGELINVKIIQKIFFRQRASSAIYPMKYSLKLTCSMHENFRVITIPERGKPVDIFQR